ncbi:MAG: condensation domain-containing protein [Pseudomonadota bacterium]
MAWVAPIIFDISVKQIFSALLQGHTLYPAPDHTRFDGEALYSFFQQNQIDVTDGTPVHLKLLQPVVDANPDDFCVKHLIIAGDILARQVVTQFLNTLTATPEITNIYGVAECTVATTFYRITDHDLIGNDTLPIGRPLSDQHIYIVNDAQQLQPVGVSGELYLGGSCVGSGYWQRDDLTQNAFLPDPFQQSGMVYRTGDMAQFRDDGQVLFLGRRNHQVKLRGYRIELQEIEFQLLNYRSPFSAYSKTVTDAAVILRDAQTEDAALWGYFVADRSLAFKELRNHLRRYLPDYMVPTHFVQLDRLPLTPNGKIDRQTLALTDADEIRPEAEPDFVAPTTPVQHILVDIWQSVLKVEQVGLHDNFFDLGGDSIMAIQISARLAERGFDMTPNTVFKAPTLADLASLVHATKPQVVEEEPVEGVVPLTPIQQRYLTQQQSHPEHYNQWCRLTMPADTCIDTLESALNALMAHHDSLRLGFHQTASGWQQVYRDAPQTVAIERVDVSAHRLQERQQIVTETTAGLQSQLDLAAADLVRAAAFVGADTDPIQLVLIVHHLVVDGVSWLILLEDLETLYKAQKQGTTPTLPAKTASFKAWSDGLQKAEIPAAERAYWQTQPSDTELPVSPAFLASYTQRNHSVEQLVRVAVTLNEHETQRLLQSVPQVYHTQTPDILLTALTLAWQAITGQSSLRVDLESHGREDDVVPGLSLVRSVGWFTTLYPVTLTVPFEHSSQSIGTSIGHIKDLLRRVPRHGIGYGLLQDLDTPHAPGAAPVLFNYLGNLEQLLPQDAMFAFDQALGLSSHPRHTVSHAIDVSGIVVKGQLEISFISPSAIIGDVRQLARAFEKALRDLIEHCSQADAGGKTATDFELVQLDDQSFSKLKSLLNKSDPPGRSAP